MRESRLELSLREPQIVALNWPADADVSGSDPVSVARRTETHATRRTVTVAWRLELSVLTARFDQAVETLSSASGSSASGGFDMVANVDLGLAPSADVGSSDDDKSWARSVFATGRVVLEADARLVSEPHLWRFGMDLDFGATTPAVTSDDTALLEFLAAAGQDLLARAIALLREADVRLTPRVAPAGTLPAKSVQRFGLPGFAVHDRLLVGRDGNPILCLALQRDGASGGVMRLLKPFLEFPTSVTRSRLPSSNQP